MTASAASSSRTPTPSNPRGERLRASPRPEPDEQEEGEPGRDHDASARERDEHGQDQHEGRAPREHHPLRAAALDPAQPARVAPGLLGQPRGEADGEECRELDVAREVVLADEGAERRHRRHAPDAVELVGEHQARDEAVDGDGDRTRHDRDRRSQQQASLAQRRRRRERERHEPGREREEAPRRLGVERDRVRSGSEDGRGFATSGCQTAALPGASQVCSAAGNGTSWRTASSERPSHGHVAPPASGSEPRRRPTRKPRAPSTSATSAIVRVAQGSTLPNGQGDSTTSATSTDRATVELAGGARCVPSAGSLRAAYRGGAGASRAYSRSGRSRGSQSTRKSRPRRRSGSPSESGRATPAQPADVASTGRSAGSVRVRAEALEARGRRPRSRISERPTVLRPASCVSKILSVEVVVGHTYAGTRAVPASARSSIANPPAHGLAHR